MNITLTPIRHDIALVAEREGTRLILNGTACDLSLGQTCDWIVGVPELVDGNWQVTLLLPHGANAPEETLYPAVIAMSEDGPVPLPPYDQPEDVSDAGEGDNDATETEPAAPI